ncbi:thioredoxin [Immersiella caudata]|uniref:Thioredoxin n=1 Tax=Immersiella caudata TaxID=314043 RepID=A0AA40C0G8_9PEZI|nr:thioredoxin [Immersiella caudata]
MTVHPISTDASFREIIKTNKIVLLDFFATWCGPCKVISPVVSKMSDDEKYQGVYFGKIDVEVLSDLSDELDVQAMPTFLLFKDGVQMGKLLEPKPAELASLLEKGLETAGGAAAA